MLTVICAHAVQAPGVRKACRSGIGWRERGCGSRRAEGDLPEFPDRRAGTRRKGLPPRACTPAPVPSRGLPAGALLRGPTDGRHPGLRSRCKWSTLQVRPNGAGPAPALRRPDPPRGVIGRNSGADPVTGEAPSAMLRCDRQPAGFTSKRARIFPGQMAKSSRSLARSHGSSFPAYPFLCALVRG